MDTLGRQLEKVWTWAARLAPLALIVAGLYLAANYVSKAELKAETDRIEAAIVEQRTRLAAHDVALAETKTDLRHIAATLDRLEKQNAAILERLPARK